MEPSNFMSHTHNLKKTSTNISVFFFFVNKCKGPLFNTGILHQSFYESCAYFSEHNNIITIFFVLYETCTMNFFYIDLFTVCAQETAVLHTHWPVAGDTPVFCFSVLSDRTDGTPPLGIVIRSSP